MHGNYNIKKCVALVTVMTSVLLVTWNSASGTEKAIENSYTLIFAFLSRA
jgi:hypothetical protein